MSRQIPTESDIPMHGWKPYSDLHRERIRAHNKHQAKDGSIEQKPWNHYIWYYVVAEEVGEVARLFCEYELGNELDDEIRGDLRNELVQVGAMVSAWIDAIDGGRK